MVTIPDDSPLWDLLARWEHAARHGKELTPEVLARNHPELLPALRQAIAALKATSWLDRPAAPRNPADESLPAARFGDYELLGLIGSGGMGRVYKARHRIMDRVVALKVLSRGTLAGADAERFREEVRAAARLTHPNVVAAYDAGVGDDGTPYLVMEFVDGPDLARVVREQGPLAIADAVGAVRQAATALAYAHAQGLLHLDVKPANLLRGPDAVVKLLDLGLARRREAHVPDAALMGTADYLAPELTRPDATADERADVYALGCTLFHLLAGRPPFAGSVPQVIQAHRDAAVPSVRDARPGVPPALDALVQKMLVKRPEERFTSMSEVIQALDRASRTPRRAWRWAVAAVLVGLMAAVVAWIRHAPPTDVQPPVPSEPVSPVPDHAQPTTPAPDDAPDAEYRAAHGGQVRTLVFDRAGTGLFSGGDDGRVVWHDLTARTVHRTLSMPPAVTAVAVAGPRLLVGTVNGQVRIWSLDGPQPKEVHGFVRHKGPVAVLAASADGTFAVSGDGEEAHVWNLAGPPKTGPLPQTAGPVLAAHFLADRPEFATVVGRVGSLPTEVWRWKLSTTKEGVKEYHPQGVARPKESAGATAFAVSDRVMLAAVGAKVFGWEFGSGQAVGIYQGHTKPVRHLRVAGSADVAVSADDAEVHFWDAKGMTRRWKGTWPGVTAVGVSGDGRRVAVGTAAGDVQVFKVGE